MYRLLPIAFVAAATAAAARPQSLPHRVDAAMAAYKAKDRPGCAVGLFDRNGIGYAKGYGAADLSWGAPITRDTRFELGSTTKQFTALAVLMLERDGRLSAADEVRKHLPALPGRYDGITLDQLIRHTSGIPDYIELARIGQAPALHELTRANALALASSVPPVFAPGTDTAYSNTAYLLLADVVAAASGEPYGAFLDRRIFRPLGMTHTHVLAGSEPSAARATLYDVDGDSVREAEWRGRDGPGAWGIRTSIRDLALYHKALFDRASPLAPYTARMVAPSRLASGVPVTYGAGVYVGSYRGTGAVRHSGRGIVEYLRFPASGKGVAVMCNRRDADAEMLAEQLADIWLGDTLAPPPAQVRDKDFDRYVGTYVGDSGETFRIAASDGVLELEGWGPLGVVADGVLTAGPATDELRMAFGQSGSTVATFQSSRPVHLTRVTPPPVPGDASAIVGVYRNDTLRSVYEIAFDEGALRLIAPDRTAQTLRPVLPGLFTAGAWRVRVLRSDDGKPTALVIASTRLPPLRFDRVTR